MLELNLVNLESSDIKYKISKFPDGQQDVTITSTNLDIVSSINEVLIKSRFNNFKDLELILCATKALRNMQINLIHLHTPYILGARSDRQFVEGGTSYLRDVVAPILNAQNYVTVSCIDAHSDVAAACINNLKVNDNSSFIKLALTKNGKNINEFILVSPDAGALKKIYNLGEKLEYSGEMLIASKHRDVKTGKILSTHVPLKSGEHMHNNFLIVDDICDGGRTFIEIAKAIQSVRPNAEISLAITHGVFSAGLLSLNQYFEHIYCTNSVSDLNIYENFITQITVF
jgi:ribose-phosphate pyrophosphokinase